MPISAVTMTSGTRVWHVAGSCRHILPAVALFFAAGPLAAQAPAPIETRMVEVDGRPLRVQIGGWHHRESGRPIVVFQNGMGTALEAWRPILSHVAGFAPVVAYDRAGIGQSPPDGQTPTPQHVNATLWRLLEEVGAEPPYVLVGFSWGGSLIQHFAGNHPEAVVGLVFIDAPELTRWRQREVAVFAELGVDADGMAAYYEAERRMYAAAPPGARAELEMVLDVVSRPMPELESLTTPDVPTAVLIALRYDPYPAEFDMPIDGRRIWEADRRLTIPERTELLASNPEATIVLATHAGHAVHWDDPDLAIEAIRRVTFPDVARRLTRTIAGHGAPAAVDLYHRLRRSYPSERFDEELLNRLGYLLLREQNIDSAIPIFELNASEYPDAPNAHDSLGDGYAAAGRLEEALASYRRAVQLAEASGDARLANFRRNVERTEQRLRERQ
jgi:pimeloyl-ACP methyl ester carboxylesterase